ncbi:hypothetical protein LINPERHAP1_LOCUS36562 [Linum perenne]
MRLVIELISLIVFVKDRNPIDLLMLVSSIATLFMFMSIIGIPFGGLRKSLDKDRKSCLFNGKLVPPKFGDTKIRIRKVFGDGDTRRPAVGDGDCIRQLLFLGNLINKNLIWLGGRKC